MSEVASAKGELRSVLYQALSLMGSIGLRLNSRAGEIALGVSDGILVSKLWALEKLFDYWMQKDYLNVKFSFVHSLNKSLLMDEAILLCHYVYDDGIY